MKWKNRIFWLRILIMVLVIVGSYLAYAFIYRGRNEPPTKRKTTNQEAAYYTLRGQIQMLSQKEELMAFAFEDRYIQYEKHPKCGIRNLYYSRPESNTNPSYQ